MRLWTAPTLLLFCLAACAGEEQPGGDSEGTSEASSSEAGETGHPTSSEGGDEASGSRGSEDDTDTGSSGEDGEDTTASGDGDGDTTTASGDGDGDGDDGVATSGDGDGDTTGGDGDGDGDPLCDCPGFPNHELCPTSAPSIGASCTAQENDPIAYEFCTYCEGGNDDRQRAHLRVHPRHAGDVRRLGDGR